MWNNDILTIMFLSAPCRYTLFFFFFFSMTTFFLKVIFLFFNDWCNIWQFVFHCSTDEWVTIVSSYTVFFLFPPGKGWKNNPKLCWPKSLMHHPEWSSQGWTRKPIFSQWNRATSSAAMTIPTPVNGDEFSSVTWLTLDLIFMCI